MRRRNRVQEGIIPKRLNRAMLRLIYLILILIKLKVLPVVLWLGRIKQMEETAAAARKLIREHLLCLINNLQ